MKISEALTNFLTSIREDHNAPDLLDRWHIGMELQVNVSSDGGEPVPDQRGTYTNGLYEWWNFRIPKGAMTEPEFNDWNMTWPLEHAEAFGMTGWNWKDRCSVFVGFDFDAITGHAKGVGHSADTLAKVREAACALPWVEVRKSTSGKGLHLYVHLDNIPTANHTEHAALARSVLGMMSDKAGFDFAAAIDCAGGNMWFAHTKKTPGTDGLTLIKPHTQIFGESNMPANWRDHVEVVTRRRSKVRVVDADEDQFENLTSSRPRIALDDGHHDFMEFASEAGYSTIWVSDHHLLQTHTCAFRDYAADRDIKGTFETLSEGNDPGQPNCFAFPGPASSWELCRFHQGVPEAKTWGQSPDGWTMCKFNAVPDLKTAATINGGVWDGDKREWHFDHARDAVRAASLLGVAVELPEERSFRKARLRKAKDGCLAFGHDVEEGDEKLERHSHKRGESVLYTEHKLPDDNQSQVQEIVETGDIRCLVTPGGQSAGWTLRKRNPNTDEDPWQESNKGDVRDYLKAQGLNERAIAKVVTENHLDPWTLTNVPHAPEYPGGRRWNRNASQLLTPADEPGPHPTWDRVLRHSFGDLDDWLKDHPHIRDGHHYGLLWIAIALLRVFQSLPYLFFHGGQDAGKSIVFEMLRLLTTAVENLKLCIDPLNQFNGELEGAVIGYIDEYDLSKRKSAAYERIKEWVTTQTFTIRRMRTDAYQSPSTLHLIHCNNDKHGCPIFPGDTRIVSMYVPDLDPDEMIPKPRLLEQLREEAPYFMRTLKDLHDNDMPESEGRLWLPVPETESKTHAMLKELPNEQIAFALAVKEELRTKKNVTTTVAELVEKHNPTLADDAQSIGFALSSKRDRTLHTHLKTKGITCTPTEDRNSRGKFYTFTLAS